MKRGLFGLGVPVFLITAALLIILAFVPFDTQSFDKLSVDGPLWRWREFRRPGADKPSAHPATEQQDPLVKCAKKQGPFLRDARNPGRVVASPDRRNDVEDAFEPYARFPWCWLNSLELHDPFAPLCEDRQSLLTAMTGGGRTGMDMPYAPRGCDMRWYKTEEICGILARFSRIWIIGDSMMRHLASAMHVLLRENLFNGARTSWKDDPEDDDCTCEKAFSHGGCLFNEAFSTDMVWENDPDSLHCPQEVTASFECEFSPQSYNVATEYPLGEFPFNFPDRDAAPQKPVAFVLGHGLWNNLNESATQLWLDTVESNINASMRWLAASPDAFYPRLFISPSVGGEGKPAIFHESQGHLATARFERNMSAFMATRGVDFLGTYNLTVQSTSPDGTHAGWRSNLLKAMMVLNWLDRLEWDVEEG